MAVVLRSKKEIPAYTDINGDNHGFLSTRGIMTTIDPPGSTGTTPGAITAIGDIAGAYGDAEGVAHGFLYSDGSFTNIDFPGAANSYVTGLNASGRMAGFYLDAAGTYHGLVDTNGSFVSIRLPGRHAYPSLRHERQRGGGRAVHQRRRSVPWVPGFAQRALRE
jgi:hypothetical protein